MTFEEFIVSRGYISELGMYHVRQYQSRSVGIVQKEYRTTPNCLLLLSAVSESVIVSMWNKFKGHVEYHDTTKFPINEFLYKALPAQDMMDTKTVVLSIDTKLRKIVLGTCSTNENQIIKAKTILSQAFPSYTTETLKILEVPYLKWVKNVFTFNRLTFSARELDVTVDEKLKTIFRIAVEKRASDISFESFEDGTHVLFYIDQEWHEFTNYVFPLGENTKALDNRLLSMGQIATNALSEKTIDAAIPSLGYVDTHRGRLNRIASNYGITTNIRILPNKPSFINLATLNYSPFVSSYIRFLSKPRKGLVLIMGETNSGKNTSVFSILTEILRKIRLKAISVESPIEYFVPKVNQIEAKDDREYKDIARAVVRQSPNIFYISEIRDEITMDSALTLSNQGKYSISTLHVSHAYQLFNRAEDIIGKDVSNKMTTELIGVINQKLMPKSCPECRTTTTYESLDKDIRDILGNHQYTGPIYINTGETENKEICPYCEGQGTKHLVPIAEFINFDDKLKRSLRKCKHLSDKEELLQDLMVDGKNTLADDALRHMGEGNLNINTLINKSILTNEYSL